MPTVSIEITPDVFDRFSELTFKPSQAIAEFIDNAIQSYLDHKDNNMFFKPGYKLVVDVFIEWGETKNNKTYAKSITIKDNAAGISKSRYDCAFETGHKPDFNEGLNEYGMGMKVAAFWLSKRWTITSKNFAEPIERTLVQDVVEIISKKLRSLEYTENSVSNNSSYTIVRLENLYSKNNFTKAKLNDIKKELASIYRTFLRRGEIQININDEALVFEDLQMLRAPYFADPNGKPIEWKTYINKAVFGKEIKGYIGILKEMSENKSGLVIIRRGRVIVGESRDHLYHPNTLFGKAQNSHLYKRLYGEIEIKGFSASFNKNGFSDVDELEEMLTMLKPYLFIEGFSILKQASELRIKTTTPAIYTVTWVQNNGESDIVQSYQSGSNIIMPNNPTKSNHIFVGWAPNPTTVVTSNVTYIAQWKNININEPEYLIRWIFGNGSPELCAKYKKGEEITIPSDPIKEGFTFIKWEPTPTKIALMNVSYVAQWKRILTPIPTSDIIATKEFVFNGENICMNLIKDSVQKTLMVLDMTKYQSQKIVECKLNISLLPVVDKTLSNSDVKNLLLSIAIAFFEAQMNDEDTCEGLIKYIK